MTRFLFALLTLTTLAACAVDDDLGKGLQDVGRPDPFYTSSMSELSSSMMVEP